MFDYTTLILFLSFLIIAVAANQLSTLFQKAKLPIITGLLLIGIVSGPFVLKLLDVNPISRLQFVNDISLAFIAFAAAAELYLKDLRNRMRSIKWMTFGQLVVTFVMSSVAIYLLGDIIPFMMDMSTNAKVAVAILMATVFVARSPASAIAVINEVRAKGPFTQTAMGVTVLKDFLVIVLFAICFSISNTLLSDESFSLFFILIAGAALLAADISITTYDPWFELERMALGLVTPDFFSLPDFGRALFNTISFALLGIAGAVVVGFILSLFFDSPFVRMLFT